jgi:hypothetical protein
MSSTTPPRSNEEILAEKESVARYYVGHWPQNILERICYGEPFPGSLGCSLKRLAVLERASLIILDVLNGRRPTDPEAWSRDRLTERVIKLRTQRGERGKLGLNLQHTVPAVTHQADSFSWRQGALKREQELADAARRNEQAHLAQRADSALPSEVRDLRRQIQEVTAMITSKEESLYYDTLNEHAHDRLYESVQRDKERLVLLVNALATIEQQKPINN